MIKLPRLAALAASILLLVSTAFAGELRDYAPTKVAPHTWVIHGPLGDPSVANQGFMNNPAFIVTRDGFVVIDPGSSAQAGRMVLRQIRQLTDQPVTNVLNTHVHGDHWLGNEATFQGNIAACDRALTSAVKVFVPGHGKTGGSQIVTTYRDYLATLFETVKHEFDAGKQDYEMKDTVKARLAAYTDWEGFDLHFGRHISVAVLELEAM